MLDSHTVKYPIREPPISDGTFARRPVWLMYKRVPVREGSRLARDGLSDGHVRFSGIRLYIRRKLCYQELQETLP
jgi:hypothetical protein